MATMDWDDQQTVNNTVIMFKMENFILCDKILEISSFPRVKGQSIKINIAYMFQQNSLSRTSFLYKAA